MGPLSKRWRGGLFALFLIAKLPLLGYAFGPCLDAAWVKANDDDGTAGQRDATGRLKNPFLQSALAYRRYKLHDPRTSSSSAFTSSCLSAAGASIVDQSQLLDSNGNKITTPDGALVLELNDWDTHKLTTMVFSIIATDVYGFHVVHVLTNDKITKTQRMSSALAGVCTPTHANLEVWASGKEADLKVYDNESFAGGGIGYFGRSGLYTTTSFVSDATDGKIGSARFYPDFWRSYTNSEDLFTSLSMDTFKADSAYYPISTNFCPDNTLGCKNQCSRTTLCTQREAANKKCIVVILMEADRDPGYVQASFDNLGIPAYFCFLGLDKAQQYALHALSANRPVVFYHWVPQSFHVQNDGKFSRIFLPGTGPDRVSTSTGTFGEKGYGLGTNNLVNIDFQVTTLMKYGASVLQSSKPLRNYFNRFLLSDLHINNLLKEQYNHRAEGNAAIFDVACSWVKSNYSLWKSWLDALPMCNFETYGNYSCTDMGKTRNIGFHWINPHPNNSSMPYDCDGNFTALPANMTTSRDCDYVQNNLNLVLQWANQRPKCDSTYYEYTAQPCNKKGERIVSYAWLNPNPADATKSVECIDGDPLPAQEIIKCEYMPHSATTYLAIVIIAIILSALYFMGMLFVFKKRELPIIKRSQYEMLEMMLGGAILLNITVIVYGGSPSKALCVLRPLFLSTGFTTVFGALIMKSYRVYRVFRSKAMKRVIVSTAMMFKYMAVMYFIDVIVFIIWYAFDAPRPKEIEDTDSVSMHRKILRQVCYTSQFGFVALMFFWKGLVLAVGIYLAFLIRKVSSDFQESLWMFFSAMVVLLGCFVTLGIAYGAQMDGVVMYVILAVAILLCTAFVMASMLLPKFFRLNATMESAHSGGPSTTSDSTAARNKGEDNNSSSAGGNASQGAESEEDGADKAAKITPVPGEGNSKH